MSNMYAKNRLGCRKLTPKRFSEVFEPLFLSMPQRSHKSKALKNQGLLLDVLFNDILATVCQYIRMMLFFNDYFPKI